MAGWGAVLRLKIRNQVAEPDESQNLLDELDSRGRRLLAFGGMVWRRVVDDDKAARQEPSSRPIPKQRAD